MVIDKNGKIVYKGHPSSRNLEADFDTLRKGENLTGNGVYTGEKKEEGGETEEKIPEGMKEVDAAAIGAEIDGFKTVGEDL